MSDEPTGVGPLQGRRIVVTRPASGAGDLAERLKDAGAVAVVLPLVETVPVQNGELAAALARLASYDWIVFTSATAVRCVAEALRESGLRSAPLPVSPALPRIGVVGPATAAAVHEAFGRECDAMPTEFRGGALAQALASAGSLVGTRVLWPRAQDAREELPRGLRRAGALLDDVVAYRTVVVPENVAALARRLEAGTDDAVTFTSPSAVRALAAAAPPTADVCVAVIGPATAAAARDAGWQVGVEPDTHTVPALVDALADWFRDA